jgi:hypothetical protein
MRELPTIKVIRYKYRPAPLINQYTSTPRFICFIISVQSLLLVATKCFQYKYCFVLRTPASTTTMNDDSHSNSPPTEPVRVNTALRAGTRGFTEAELLEELVKTPETSPMLMPVDQRRAESGDRASEYSSWGSSPARVSSTGSSPRMFVSSGAAPEMMAESNNGHLVDVTADFLSV